MNGWKNRETWLVNLWFGDTLAMMQDDGDVITAYYIESMVTDYIDEIVPASSFIADMIDLRAIDYAELARHYAPETADAE